MVLFWINSAAVERFHHWNWSGMDKHNAVTRIILWSNRPTYCACMLKELMMVTLSWSSVSSCPLSISWHAIKGGLGIIPGCTRTAWAALETLDYHRHTCSYIIIIQVLRSFMCTDGFRIPRSYGLISGATVKPRSRRSRAAKLSLTDGTDCIPI